MRSTAGTATATVAEWKQQKDTVAAPRNPIPEFLMDSVARWREKLSDWPDYETRYSGDGAVTAKRDVVDRDPPTIPMANRKTCGVKNSIGTPPAHQRPGMSRKPAGNKLCAHKTVRPYASYFGKERELCADCNAVLWAK